MANHGRIPARVKSGGIAARALGASNREISQRFKVSEATITRTVRDARVEEISREFTSNWRDGLIEGAKRAVMDALENPEHYNRGKIGVSVLKGLGLFQTAGKAGDTTAIQQNNFFASLTDEQLKARIATLREFIELSGGSVDDTGPGEIQRAPTLE